MKIIIMASTNGTDLQAIIDSIKNKELDVELSLVFSNKECYAIERAREQGIKTSVLKIEKDESRENYDKRCSSIIGDVDLIVLVGYMRLFSSYFINKYKNKIINIHPSLLPDFPGMDLNVHKEVLESNVTKSGMTIHFVDEGMDTGSIIFQKEVLISKNETISSLKEKVQNLEKKWYPKVIQMFKEGKIQKKEGEKVKVDEYARK